MQEDLNQTLLELTQHWPRLSLFLFSLTRYPRVQIEALLLGDPGWASPLSAARKKIRFFSPFNFQILCSHGLFLHPIFFSSFSFPTLKHACFLPKVHQFPWISPTALSPCDQRSSADTDWLSPLLKALRRWFSSPSLEVSSGYSLNPAELPFFRKDSLVMEVPQTSTGLRGFPFLQEIPIRARAGCFPSAMIASPD